MFESKYIFEIEINETKTYRVENKDVREFQSVKIYLGSPWIKAQSGYIGSLTIATHLKVKFS